MSLKTSEQRHQYLIHEPQLYPKVFLDCVDYEVEIHQLQTKRPHLCRNWITQHFFLRVLKTFFDLSLSWRASPMVALGLAHHCFSNSNELLEPT
ncbi:hypothetical protein MTR_7g117525 [Medicago truncatula]|uniref:Uncharacterized protein n=1 Tax=Medicago truncatula TaxID=3880 RepID=A0A072U4I9_MEDTR|nr:hypothetical protein MTR_7g117525 [Medicago truncatula]